MLEVSALASGSSGNCFYVGNETSAVLIDVGISAKQVIERLLKVGGKPEKIKAIFITHEHIDHIKGSDVLARKLNVPIFSTKDTAKKGFLCSNPELINWIKEDSVIQIDKLKIEAFSKSHSAANPVSYSILENKKVSVITDAGHACKNINGQISNCDFLFIEANHDEQMLHSGPYPKFLKAWVSGSEGHLSNRQAALSVLEFASPKLKRIILSHLSRTNNSPEIALQTFTKIIKERHNFFPEIHVSIKENPTQLFKV